MLITASLSLTATTGSAFAQSFYEPEAAQTESTSTALMHLNRHVTLEGKATHIHTDIDNASRTIDKWLPSGHLGLSWLFANGAYIDLEGSYTGLSPDVTILGQKHSLHYQDISGQAKLGWGFPVNDRLLLIPHVTYAHAYGSYKYLDIKWHSNANYMGGGLKTDFAFTRRLIGTFDWSVGGNFSNRAVHTDLGSGIAAMAKGEIDYRVINNWHAVGNVTYQHNSFKYLDKDDVALGAGVRFTF